jgi:2-dehydropantoate 2-reductase
MERPRVGILGPGGVGGLLAVALEQAGTPTVVVARESTCQEIDRHGIRLRSVRFGGIVSHPHTAQRLTEPVDALIVATKAIGLQEALQRIECDPPLVVPLLNGLDHLELLRRRFPSRTVAAGAIRVEADRPQPGVVVHTSKFLRVDMAGKGALKQRCEQLADELERAGVPARVLESEAEVMWGKLVRLNALACTTSAYDMPIGPIRTTPELRADLIGAIEEGCAVATAEGAGIDPAEPLRELSAVHASLGSSMQRDIAAGRTPELDAIPGAVLRAAARHGIECPTVERLVAVIAERAGIQAPTVVG